MKSGRRRVVFVKAPAAVPLPVLFIKAVTLAPEPALAPAHVAAPVEPDDFDWAHPCTGRMVDILVKATHDGFLSARDLSRASEAYLCLKPLPHDLIETVLVRSR